MKLTLRPWIVALAVAFTASVAPSQTTWTNNAVTGMWTNPAIWTGPVAGYPNGVDSVALFNGASLVATQSRGITNDASVTNGSIVFVGTAANNTGFNLWTNNANGRLYLDVSSGSALIANATNAGTGANQLIMPVTMLDALVISNNGTLNLAGEIAAGGNDITARGDGVTTLSRSISGGSSLTKAGTGSLILGGSNNSFSGGITLDEGTLGIAVSGRKSGVEAAFGSATITANGGILNLSADNFNGLVITNPLVLNGDLTVKGSGQNQYWQAPISGTGRLILTNTTSLIGILGLYTNSYSGGTVVSNTQLGLNGNLALGTGPVTIYSATLSGGAAGLTISNDFLLSGAVSFTANMPVYVGTWDLLGGTRSFVGTPGSGNSVWLMGALTNGTANFIKGNANLLTFQLGASNTVTGTTLVDGAALTLASNAGSMVWVDDFVLNAGTLTVDNRSGVPAFSRLNPAAGVALTNATLQIIGPGTAGQIFTQQVGAVSLNLGANTLQVTNRGTFLADTLSRAAGATLNVNGTNFPTAYVNNAPTGTTNGIVPWAVINGAVGGFAGWSGGALGAYAGYTNVVADDPNANVKLSGASLPVLASSRTINSLWISNSGANLDLGGNVLTIASGGLAFGPDPTPWISNGVVNFGPAEGVIYNDRSVRIYAGLDGQAGVTKSGTQQLYLYGTNTYSGDTRVNQGNLILQGGTISNGNNLVVAQGAIFQLLGGSVDIASLQAPSNWLGTTPAIAVSSGDLVTRSNSTAHTVTLGQDLVAPASWTMLGGSNYVGTTLGTNATLRVSGAGTTLVSPLPAANLMFGGVSNSVIVGGGAAFSAVGGNFNFNMSAGAFRIEGSNTTVTAFSGGNTANFGFGGRDSVLVLSNGAAMTTGRGYVGIPYSPSGPYVGGTNIEMIVDDATYGAVSASGGYLRFGYGIGAVSNRLTVRNGSEVTVGGGTGSPLTLGFGEGATASQTRAEISGSSLVRLNSGNSAALVVGNPNPGGTDNAFVLSEGSLLQIQGGVGYSNILRTVGSGNVISNLSSTLELGGLATVGIYVTNTPGTIVFTNTVLSWRGRADGYVTPVIAGTTLTNITWQGDHGFMLNGSTNAAGLAAYAFDSVANTGASTNFQRLLLAGTNSLWRSARLDVASGGALTVTNAIGANVQGITTNAGTIRVINSTVTWRSNMVVSGLYYSDPSTNTFATNLAVAASGALQGSNGDLFVFWRDWSMQSTNTQFNLSSAAVLFTNGAGTTAHHLSISNSGALNIGQGFGSFAEVATNFALGQLSIAAGNRLTVAGNEDSLTNALYVGWLDLQGAATNSFAAATNSIFLALNLPNINLYYDKFDPRNDWLNAWIPETGYDLWSGGLLLPIPEPSAWAAFAVGLALLAFLRRRTAA